MREGELKLSSAKLTFGRSQHFQPQSFRAVDSDDESDQVRRHHEQHVEHSARCGQVPVPPFVSELENETPSLSLPFRRRGGQGRMPRGD